MFLLNVLHAPDMSTYNPDSFEIFLMMLNFPSVFVLWFWMISDFFKNGTPNKKVLRGLSLFMGSVLASLVYFVMHWRPRFANGT